MKRFIISLLLAFVFASGVNAQNKKQPRIDHWLRMAEKSYMKNSSSITLNRSISQQKNQLKRFGIDSNKENPIIRAIIEFNGTDIDLERHRVKIRTRIGNLLYCRVSNSEIKRN